MFDNTNQYNVHWNLQVNTKTAFQNLAQYTHAVNAATQASLRLQDISRNMLKAPKVSSTGASATNNSVINSGQKSSQMSGAFVGGNNQSKSTQPSTPQSGTQKSTAQSAKARTSGAYLAGTARGRASKSYQNPLKNTPFVGLMGTMLAYSAVSSEVSQAAEYASIMTTAKAILQTADSDLSTFESRFDTLAKNVRKIGVETKFTAKEVADATKYLAMAGLSTEAINASMRPIANLAIIADEDLGLIADLTTNIMTGYGIDPQSMGSVSDVLTSVMTRSNVSITEIAESYKMSAGFLRSAGVDFNEAAAAIGVLGDAGIKATMAGTALRAMSVRFAKPTKEASAVLERLGVSFTETVDRAGESVVKVRPLFQIFGDLKKSGATLEDMQKVFGTIGGNAAINLIENADKIERLRRATLTSHGVTESVAAKKQATVNERWTQMTSAFSEQFTKSFEILTPQIQETLISITKAISSDEFGAGLHSMTSMFTQLFGVIMKGMTFVVDNMHIIKPLLMSKFFISNISGILNSITSSFGILSGSIGLGAVTNIKSFFGTISSFVLSNPIGIISALVGVIATAGIEAKQFYDANNSAFNAINDGAPSTVSSYNKITGSINKAIEAAIKLRGLQPSSSGKSAEEETGITDSAGWFAKGVRTVDDALNPFNYVQAAVNVVSDVVPSMPRYKIGLANPYMFSSGDYFGASARSQQASALGIKDATQISGELIQQLGITTDPKKIDELKNKVIKNLPKPINYGGGIYEQDAHGNFYIKKGDGSADYLKNTKEYSDALWGNVLVTLDNVTKYSDFMSSNNPAKMLQSMVPEVSGLFEQLELDSKTGKYVLPKLKSKATPEEIRMYQNKLSYINSLYTPLATKNGGIGALFGDDGAYNVLSRVFGDDVMSVTPTANLSTMSVKGMAGGDGGLGDLYGGSGGRASGLTRSGATPKQVIINIDNMLNMENVSINEDNKGQVFSDLKRDLAEILTDVISDTSASFHG